MQSARRSNATTLAEVSMSADDCLRVSVEQKSGSNSIDLRVFTRFTMAKVFMPTKHAITVAAELLPELIAALQVAQAAIGAPA